MKKYNSLDVTKFIMAIAVVAIHTRPLEHCNSPLQLRFFTALVELAVPFFFLASGFLLGKKAISSNTLPYHTETIWNHILKTIKLYTLWSIIYLPLSVYDYIARDVPFWNALVDYIRRFLFVGGHYNTWMLWYLLSTIYTLFFVYFLMQRKVPFRIILVLSLFIGIFGRSGFDWLISNPHRLAEPWSTISVFLKATFDTGMLFVGFIYIPLGMSLANRGLPLWIALPCCIGGFTLMLRDPPILFTICLAVCSLGLFSIILQVDLQDAKLYPALRSMSTALYFTHMWIWTIYYHITYGYPTFGPDCFFATLGIGIVVGLLYFCLRASLGKRSAKKPGRLCQ